MQIHRIINNTNNKHGSTSPATCAKHSFRYAVNYITISALSIISIATIINICSSSVSTSALSYSSSSDISFTFRPTLSIGLSTDSLTIDNLVPGNTSDSNKVTVTVSSNTPYGYVLSAGVGSSDSTSTYYNTSDLVHDNSTIPTPTTSKFTSIDTASSLDNLTTDNTWGYSTSTDNGTTWSTYSGLSHTQTKPLLDISDSAQPSTIDFKIAARSSTTQASGAYNNVITFYAVGKPEPVFYMQDTATIKAELQNVGDEMQATDIRDDKKYWIRKMADGKIWMTQNLDLELDSNITYTSADTDVSTDWRPARSTGVPIGASVSGWDNDNYAPFSVSPGEIYVYTSGTRANDSQYTSLASCQAEHPDCSAHNHVGNYYNWSAAVASNNTNTTELKTRRNDAPNSICPAGWRLPITDSATYTETNREWSTLLAAEGIMDNPAVNSYATNGMNNIRIAPLWLIRSGVLKMDGSPFIGTGGCYWPSRIFNGTNAYYFSFGTSLSPTADISKSTGYSVRCLVK